MPAQFALHGADAWPGAQSARFCRADGGSGDAPVSKGVLTFTVDAYDSQVFWTECTQSGIDSMQAAQRAPAASEVSAAPTATDLALPMQILPNATNGLPRYVVGQVIVGGRLQHATFDAGNPKASILTAAGCLGCGAGCPKQVPACPPPAQFCRPSAPQEYVPAGSYQVNASAACPPGVLSAGTLDGKVV